MKKSKLFYRINLGVVILLGIGWFYFYWFILTTDISKMLNALTTNTVISSLNLIFVASLILLPISYKWKKRK